jgi:hypothetical protein
VQAHQLHHDLQKRLRCFGRQCREIGKMFVTLVRLTYKGHRGAIVQMGMAIMAHNVATLVRLHEYRLSKRARTFRRRLRLRCRNVNQLNASIN